MNTGNEIFTINTHTKTSNKQKFQTNVPQSTTHMAKAMHRISRPQGAAYFQFKSGIILHNKLLFLSVI